MEIRPLQIGDLFTISRMLERARANEEKLTSPKEVLVLLMDEFADNFLAWLADLVGKEVKEFETMPAATVLDIVEKLSLQDNFQEFLFWVRVLSQPGGRGKLVKVFSFLHRFYGIPDVKTPLSRFSQAMGEVAKSRQKEVEDTLAEAEEIIALARGERD